MKLKNVYRGGTASEVDVTTVLTAGFLLLIKLKRMDCRGHIPIAITFGVTAKSSSTCVTHRGTPHTFRHLPCVNVLAGAGAHHTRC